MTRPSSPFQIHISVPLSRFWLPDSTLDAPKMNPFANHISDVLMANASRTFEQDQDGHELVWMVIQEPDRFSFDDIRNLFKLAEAYQMRAYVWHWPAYTISNEPTADSTLLGDKYLVPLKQDDGDWMNGAQLVEYAAAGGSVLSRKEAEEKRAEVANA